MVLKTKRKILISLFVLVAGCDSNGKYNLPIGFSPYGSLRGQEAYEFEEELKKHPQLTSGYGKWTVVKGRPMAISLPKPSQFWTPDKNADKKSEKRN